MTKKELFNLLEKATNGLIENQDISIKTVWEIDWALGNCELMMMDFDELETFIFGVYQGIKAYEESKND